MEGFCGRANVSDPVSKRRNGLGLGEVGKSRKEEIGEVWTEWVGGAEGHG